jgi:hypothetical protein
MTISYTKDAGCIQTARLQNYAWWRRGSTTPFSWGLESLTQPQYGGDPCGNFSVWGTAKQTGGTPSDCYAWQPVYTDYNFNAITVRVSDGYSVFAANADIYTGTCDLYWDRIAGWV